MFRIDKQYDHWSFERTIRHVFYWGFWTLFFTTVNGAYKEGQLTQWFLYEALVVPVKIVTTYYIIYYLTPRFLYQNKYVAFSIGVVLTVILGSLGIRTVYYFVIAPQIFSTDPGVFLSSKFFYVISDLIYIAGLVFAIKVVQHRWIQEKANTQLKEDKLKAELKLLKNQLQPHFLFNTLNNLYSLILSKSDKAEDVILRLSDMLNYMLYECEDSHVALDKEISILENYVQLELMRYGQKLDFKFTRSGTLGDQQIAPLLLFPLLENAFKHGPAKAEKKAFIHVSLHVESNKIEFETQNSKSSKIENDLTPGIGLQNVRTRLSLLYPGKHWFEAKDIGTTFTTKLKLDLS